MAGDRAYVEILSATSNGTKVKLSNGRVETFTGDRAYRNNNPGNLTGSTKRAISRGALGVDYGGNNIYPTMQDGFCLLYTSPSPRDGLLSRMPSSA